MSYFTPDQFKPTKWSTAHDKAKFANSLKRFVESGFKVTLWKKPLYNRLSQCFQHIAHYDADGFYQEWFTSKNKWIHYILSRPVYGDPEWTYSDVEREFKKWLQEYSNKEFLFSVY